MNNNYRRSRRNKTPRPSAAQSSCCGEMMIRGTAPQIAAKYEEMAEDALSMGNLGKAHMFWNYAEHYKKEKEPV